MKHSCLSFLYTCEEKSASLIRPCKEKARHLRSSFLLDVKLGRPTFRYVVPSFPIVDLHAQLG